MSGGHFDYQQYNIQRIVDEIEQVLLNQGKPLPKDELYASDEYYKEHPEEMYYYTYPVEIQRRFKDGITFLKIAQIYAQRIDWLLSGDDSEKSFIERLKEELEEQKP